MSAWSKLPSVVPGFGMTPHMSPRAKQDLADAVFWQVGGQERLVAFVEANDENYKFYLQHIWARNMPKAQQTEITASEGVEALLAKIDAGEHARVISPDGAPQPVHAPHPPRGRDAGE